MKKIIYLLTLTVFVLSCDKIIDIEYDTNVKEDPVSVYLYGTWESKLTTRTCKEEYTYTFRIKSKDKGKLTIYRKSKKDSIVYDVKIEKKKKGLYKLETSNKIEYTEDLCDKFCEENTFYVKKMDANGKDLLIYGSSDKDCTTIKSEIPLKKK